MESSVAPQPVDRAAARELAQRWMEAWDERDADALLELATEDIAYDDPAWPETLHGKAGVRQFLEFCWRGMPDMRFTTPMGAFFADEGARVIIPWHMSATFTGEFDPPGYAPTGDRVELDGIDMWELRGDKICRYWAYYDATEVARQTGVLPPRGSRAERMFVRLQRLMSKRRRPRG
jgi:steroid delta-isomerase-like uncharacterized protein